MKLRTNELSHWEHFPHDADVGVRGFGASPEAAFEQAALALTAAVTSAKVEPKQPVEVSCEAPHLELMFVEWLNCVIYEMAVRRMLFGRFAVRIEGPSPRGDAVGRAGRRFPARSRLRTEGGD
jgi:SHS2 domain-containing protein